MALKSPSSNVSFAAEVFTEKQKKINIVSELSISDESPTNHARRDTFQVYNVRKKPSHGLNSANLRLRTVPQGFTSEQALTRVKEQPNSKRSEGKRKYQVRKLLKFRHGILQPSTDFERDAIEAGREATESKKREAIQQFKQKMGSQDYAPRKRMSQNSLGPKGAPKKGAAQGTGFVMQNKLVQRSHHLNSGARNSSLNMLLYRLSKQQEDTEEPIINSSNFFKEDMYSSARYKDKEETGNMQIRYDEQSKVLSRSICGTKHAFHKYLDNKAKEQAKLERKKKLFRGMSRQSTFGAGSKLSIHSNTVSKGNLITNFIKPTAKRSTTNAIFLGNLDEQLRQQVNRIHEMQDDEESRSFVSTKLDSQRMPINIDDRTEQQKRLQAKHHLHKRAWNIFQSQVRSARNQGRSLMEQ